MRPIYWLALFVASFGWASGGILTRAALNEGVGEWTMVAVRVPIAALLVGIVLLARRTPPPTPAVLRFGLVQSIFNLSVPYVLFTFAYGEASAGFVGLLAGLIPLSAAIWAHFRLPDEPMSVRKAVALLVAFSGVAFLLLSGDSGLSEGGRPALAVALGLTAVTSVGFSNAFAKKHAGTYDPVTATGLQFAFASVWLLAAMFVIEGAPTDVTGLGWLFITAMAFLSTFVPFMLYYWLLQHVSATDVSLTGYLVPFITLTGGLLLLDEELQFGIVVGFTLVFIGLVLSNRVSRRDAATVAIETAGTLE